MNPRRTGLRVSVALAAWLMSSQDGAAQSVQDRIERGLAEVEALRGRGEDGKADELADELS